MSHRRRVGVLAVLLACALAGAAGTDAGTPTDEIHAAIDALYRVLVPGAAGRAQPVDREEAAKAILDRLFDWTAMAKDSLGEHWNARAPAERAEFTVLFADVFRRAFVSRLHLVDVAKFQYLGDRIDGERATVQTRVPTRRGSLINVEYVAGLRGGREWRVQDVRVEGISLVENYRSQFHAIIASSSYAALVKRLRDRSSRSG